MPKIKVEGYVLQENLKEKVDKLKEIFDSRASLDMEFSLDERFPFATAEIKKTKRVGDFCKENRCWAAKDKNGLWAWYIKEDKPYCKDNHWGSKSGGALFGSLSMIDFPTYISWDKSLVAPDGRFILIEGKKEKRRKEAKFKVGKWYRNKNTGVWLYCKSVVNSNVITTIGSVNVPTVTFYIDNLSDWYEIKHYNPDKKKKSLELKRGEPIFVWDRYHNPRLPAVVRYFHSFDKDGMGVFTCNESLSNEQGTWYQYYRRYDSTLVGVPRKDWPKISV